MRNIFFDLDGTLTDPKIGIVRCIQYALSELSEPVASEDDLLWCIGPPLQDSFLKLLGSKERSEKAMILYRQRFAEIGMFENAVYSGIPEVLEAFKNKDMRLFVATSKPHVFANKILKHFGLDAHFEMVFGAEMDGTRADKTDLLRHALHEADITDTTATMIGDRKHDVIGARNNNLNSIGVLYGYGSRQELQDAQAHVIVEHPSDLMNLVFNPL